MVDIAQRVAGDGDGEGCGSDFQHFVVEVGKDDVVHRALKFTYRQAIFRLHGEGDHGAGRAINELVVVHEECHQSVMALVLCYLRQHPVATVCQREGDAFSVLSEGDSIGKGEVELEGAHLLVAVVQGKHQVGTAAWGEHQCLCGEGAGTEPGHGIRFLHHELDVVEVVVVGFLQHGKVEGDGVHFLARLLLGDGARPFDHNPFPREGDFAQHVPVVVVKRLAESLGMADGGLVGTHLPAPVSQPR